MWRSRRSAREDVRQKAPIVGIDDDPAILDARADILTCEGYTVERAKNGAEGRHLLEQFEPRLVRLDMRMPVLDGRLLCHLPVGLPDIFTTGVGCIAGRDTLTIRQIPPLTQMGNL